MNVVTQAVWDLVVDLRGEAGQATEGSLDVAARAAEPVIEVEVAERGIEVVDPDQLNDAAAEPDAFRVSGGAVNGLSGFRELVDLALVVLRDIGRVLAGLGLVLGILVAALGKGASDAEKEDEPGDCEMAQNTISELKQPSTHKFPDFSPACRPAADIMSDAVQSDAVQMGPECGENDG